MSRPPRALASAAGPADLAAGLMLAAPAAAETGYSDDERTALRAEIRAYLLEHPEVLFEAVAEYRTPQRRGAGRHGRRADRDQRRGYLRGRLFLGRRQPRGRPDPGRIRRLPLRFLPPRLRPCHGLSSRPMAISASWSRNSRSSAHNPRLSSRLAVAVLELGGDAAYAKWCTNGCWRSRRGDGKRDRRAWSVELGIDPETVMDRMAATRSQPVLAENRALAQRLQINGTPSFVLGGPEDAELIRGFLPGRGPARRRRPACATDARPQIITLRIGDFPLAPHARDFARCARSECRGVGRKRQGRA
jgi:hypothetical protein